MEGKDAKQSYKEIAERRPGRTARAVKEYWLKNLRHNIIPQSERPPPAKRQRMDEGVAVDLGGDDYLFAVRRHGVFAADLH